MKVVRSWGIGLVTCAVSMLGVGNGCNTGEAPLADEATAPEVSVARQALTLPHSGKLALKTAMKGKGCVFDGLLNFGASDTYKAVALLDRSRCQYVHRALDTWKLPPDFERAQDIESLITRPDMIYGMFIAEAISTIAEYFYPDEYRNFDFASMCTAGTHGKWGENTCTPSFASAEYRKYVLYVTRRAVELGFRDIAFGQVELTDTVSSPILPGLMDEIRQYASARGKVVLMGGQTNAITSESYLRTFDYVFGGVGQKADGVLESGACASKYPGTCWALLWHPTWASKANDVMLHFDWWSNAIDDQSTFAAMTPTLRASVLSSYYDFFLDRGYGFAMPYNAPLSGSGNGCSGGSAWEYSADNSYTCDDESAIDSAFGNRKPDLATCTTNSECAANICIHGYCGFKPNGWGCGSDDVCASSYCASGTCAARKPDQSTCSAGNECQGNVCLDGYCGLKPDAWGCLSDAACASNYCAAGVCTSRKPDLATCTAANQCASYLCIHGYCGLKPAGWGCTSTAQCASHVCTNGYCG